MFTIAIVVLCNKFLHGVVERYRFLNNGFEVNPNLRTMDVIYSTLTLLAIALDCAINHSSFWWGIIGYFLGHTIFFIIINNAYVDLEDYIGIGAILQPLLIIVSVIFIFCA